MSAGSPLGLPTPGRTPSPNMQAGLLPPRVVPLTCHGHSRPVTHLHFSDLVDDENYFLISACKDGNPMLRDGITGDWIGTFMGHKGAVWQARLSPDASLAATASADFSAKIWDTHTGENLTTLTHNHIVRTVAFSPSATQVATGGPEKKLRVYDLKSSSPSETPIELGPGIHTGTIKSVAWSSPTTLISASEDKTLRWWDTRSSQPISSYILPDIPAAAEFTSQSQSNNPQRLQVAAGKSVYFFDSNRQLEKSFTTPYDCATVALHAPSKRFIAAGPSDTWARIYDWDDVQAGELEVYKGHHGPIWSVAFSPDGKLFATSSEDGTIKLWKYSNTAYGLWR